MVYIEKENNFVYIHYFYNDTNDPSIVTDNSLNEFQSNILSSIYLYIELCVYKYMFGE